MKRVLFDTNIILDIALERAPHFEDAFELFALIDQQLLVGHITASTVTDIYYIAKKEKGHQVAVDFLEGLVSLVEVIGIDKDIILQALAAEMKDFEDAVQASAAEVNDIEFIITRNKSDFTNTSVQIATPKEFLSYPR
ncbi:PIN domain-containing protein [Rhabdobacter roseus]|uniref:Putative nucleic acid-binding protein n=1 Tax=Rhabdobacter roseus TaxID=1655419 RepID=A0A840TRF8_9BACT|nr:PIN domain-containing protein [Rhabdobacter roseus]MBB5285505.1 putative nucleic acid-binding protein [Rhabdobacter roseus]